MSENFADRLIQSIHSKRSCAVVGIDPRRENLPRRLLEQHPGADQNFEVAAECYKSFGCRIVEIIAPIVPAIKPQIAFFERLGSPGIAAFEEVVRYARKLGLLVIADIKRNDIGSTAKAYAETYLGPADKNGIPASIEVDAVTLNAYLGSDGIRPFLESAKTNGKGMFILVRTSNPSAGEFQDMEYDHKKLFEQVAAKVVEWGNDLVGNSGYSSVGAVIGATYPKEAASLREQMPQNIFLVPGYGAQGGGPDDVAPCFNQDGLGAVVNAARSIIFAYQQSPGKEQCGEEHWEDAVEQAALRMKEELSRFLP